jgi:hypothetical protein
MKTINHEGKVYQVGAMYEFSDDGYHWYTDILEDIHQNMTCPYRIRSSVGFRLIRVCEVKVGTITEAPLKLKNGECYQYEDRFGNKHKGFFLAEPGRLYCTTGAIVDPSRCTNIKHLTVGENSNEQV